MAIEAGELIIQSTGWGFGPPGSRLHIAKADPRVLANPMIMKEIADAYHAGVLHLDVTWDEPNQTLTIRGDNQTVVYRIAGFDEDMQMWILEWPD